MTISDPSVPVSSVASADAFRELHHRPGEPLLLPNAWDHASACALAEAGFAAVGTTSLGVAAAAGLPDGAGRTRGETLRLVRQLARPIRSGRLLLTVDIEGGFSDDPAEVAALAGELAGAGAVGVNLEDGRADGGLTPAPLHAAKIRAVKAAVPWLFVNARTDTHWLRRGDLAETTSRLAAYQDAGADGVFVPGLAEEGSVVAAVGATGLPLNVLAVPGGPSLARLAELGVRRVSLGSLLFRLGLGTAVDAAVRLRAGDALPSAPRALDYGAVQALTE
ncbi:isocitrate lyase/phosphoenolpyruvate mutase family protein [Streptacidiphilus pinicola]|uniref:Isocitrate lyase/phosphoenolpyruvate mutase family protein n=1 Tax=Streptacidiphilus pinicola TaxID=2219663 RepID=A0A2X0IQL4_9ACTN|nr:isocitrate lyase/phosphoenolpyruvate mutase family protein [Streptacidiphilus pinicola]RAG87504.1 isocitrate lyase/phosphoenolpyruvate mutase family protein [Streptacidiphilus pinicola]